ncbi:hypothetical protein HZS_6938, partial [Henneguya salminicola]
MSLIMFLGMLCLIAINLNIVYVSKCVYKLKDEFGDHGSKKLAEANISFTITAEWSNWRKYKSDGSCGSINSSMIIPPYSFMSFYNNTDGEYCCGQQMKKCIIGRGQNSTTLEPESGKEFVERVLTNCRNMTGYVYKVRCREYIPNAKDIITMLHLESTKSYKSIMAYNCHVEKGLFTSWGQKLPITSGKPMRVDVHNQR